MNVDREVVRHILDELSEGAIDPPLLRFLLDNFDQFNDHLMLGKHIYRLHLTDTENVSKDAWSEGQLRSKLWLLQTLGELKLPLGRIWILCGWIGSLALLFRHYAAPLHFDRIRSFDVDPRCAALADTLNRPYVQDNWKFKASTLDVNEIGYMSFKFNTIKHNGVVSPLTETADTVINTSCDHLKDSTWFENISLGCFVILQNNNYSGHCDDDNCVQSLAEMKAMYPMRRSLFAGELDCGLYTRYMLIGIK